MQNLGVWLQLTGKSYGTRRLRSKNILRYPTKYTFGKTLLPILFFEQGFVVAIGNAKIGVTMKATSACTKIITR